MLTIGFLILLAFGQAVIALVLYANGRRSKRRDQMLFACLAALLVIWTLAVGYLSNVDVAINESNVAHYRLANQVAFVSTIVILLNLLIFTQYYPSKRSLGRLTKALLGFGGILAFASPLPFIAGSFTSQQGHYVYSYGMGIGLVGIFSVAVAFATYLNSRKRIRAAVDRRERKQITVLLTGLILMVVHILAFVVVLPAILGQHTVLYTVGYAGPYYLLLFTGYGLLQLGLFDIRRIIARAVGYLVTILFISLGYGFAIFAVSHLLFKFEVPVGAQIFLALATAVASLTFHDVKKFFDKSTNRIFYQDAYDTQTLFDEYNTALVSTIDLDLLLKRTSRVMVKHLKTEYCVVAIKNKGATPYRVIGTIEKAIKAEDIVKGSELLPKLHQTAFVTDSLPEESAELRQLLQKYNIGLIIKMKAHIKNDQDSLGYLALGQKKSGSPYSRQDVKVVETLANELVIALQNALRFEEIERFNETLQQRVTDATRKLRHSNEKLKQLNETKDDFIGMASHQLRTPLTSVKGYLSLVLDEDAGKINKTQRQLLTQAFVSSQRMVSLIADLLNVSRLRTGKFIIERTPTNIAEMISDEIGQLREMADSRGVELLYNAPADFPTLPLDETKTRQVVMNFIDNSIYYTPTGGRIKVELQNLPKIIELRVVDNGIGVPAGERHHLFTKFYRAKNAQRARPDGTGLGLFMAKKVITAQGGSIIFDSAEGQGSVFGFAFPKELKRDATPVPAETKA